MTYKAHRFEFPRGVAGKIQDKVTRQIFKTQNVFRDATYFNHEKFMSVQPERSTMPIDEGQWAPITIGEGEVGP